MCCRAQVPLHQLMPLLVQQIHRLPRRKHVHLFPVRTGLPSWREPVFACAFVPACAACRAQVRVTTGCCSRRMSFATVGRGVPHPRHHSGVARPWSGIALPLSDGSSDVDYAHCWDFARAVDWEFWRNVVTVEQLEALAGSRRRRFGAKDKSCRTGTGVHSRSSCSTRTC